MNPLDDIITDIIKREGGAKTTNDPKDKGGRTQFGIAEHSNPAAWADGKVTEAEARAIYLQKYVKGPGFDKIAHQRLQHQLIDFAVLSGPAIAIQKLQEAVGADIDGILGPDTLAKVNALDGVVVGNKLVAARVKMICKIVVKHPSQLRFLSGWVNRSLDFLV